MLNIKHKILLASSSRYKQGILRKVIREFQYDAPNIDETPHSDESPIDLVKRLCQTKAKVLRQQYPDHIIIASDQVACIEGEANILGKPHTIDKAVTQLRHCSGKTVQFFTGLSVNKPHNNMMTNVEIFDVTFKTLTSRQIEKYVLLDEPLDCAGSFKSEGLGIALFDSLDGRDPNSLIGLPLILLCEMLSELDIDVLDLAG